MKSSSRIKKLGERENFEIKSQFLGTKKEWLKLIKTIVAMANKSGGSIKYEKINVNFSEFDPANLDNKVNSYITPKLRGIESIKKGKGVLIKIPASNLKPHIFIKRGVYKNEKGNEVAEFYEGQIWTRHSSKNEIFDKSDFDSIVDSIVKEKIQKILEKIFDKMKESVANYPTILEASESGITIEIKPIEDKKKGVPVLKTDPNKDYPYQAKDLAQKLEKSTSYVAQLLKILGMKGNPTYNYDYKNSSGKIVLRKYNDKCLEVLRNFILKKPNFNPWHDKP